MHLKSIEYFLVVAAELNVTRAAERLSISQQALSSHIKRLEEEYHVTLFDRKPVFRLTKAGEQMVFYGRRILDAEREMNASFSDIVENARATIHFGISRLRSAVFFPLIWQFYHCEYPCISVEIVDAGADRLGEMIYDGKIDLFLAIDVPDTPGLIRREVAEERLQCCFSHSFLRQYYPDSCKEKLEQFQVGVDLRDLVGLPLITVRKGNRLRTGIDLEISKYTSPEYLLECNQQEMIYHFARQGNGVGLLSPVMLYQHSHDPQNPEDPFYSFPVKNNICTNKTYLVYRENAVMPRYMKDFINDILLVFRSYARTVSRKFS